MKKKLITLGVALAAMLLTSQAAFSQAINMGSSPVNFGSGCLSSFIQNAAGGNKLAFGANQYCVGPGYSIETIWMTTDPGRIGIGVSSPSYQIHLSQNSAGKPGSNAWTVVSDKRLKENVNTFSDGLDLVRKLNPITFHYNANSGYDTKPEYVGVYAQDLQQIAPYMVNNVVLENESGAKSDYLAVDFGAMDFVLTNAIKELDAELQVQKAENEALRSALEEIRSEINSMKSAQGQAIAPASTLIISPNPVAENATLAFRLPANTQTAAIQVWNLNGQMVHQQSLSGEAAGSVVIGIQEYAVGTYIVKLVADGNIVATERMVTSK